MRENSNRPEGSFNKIRFKLINGSQKWTKAGRQLRPMSTFPRSSGNIRSGLLQQVSVIVLNSLQIFSKCLLNSMPGTISLGVEYRLVFICAVPTVHRGSLYQWNSRVGSAGWKWVDLGGFFAHSGRSGRCIVRRICRWSNWPKKWFSFILYSFRDRIDSHHRSSESW